LFDNWRNDEQRGIFPLDEDDFSQAYYMYVKKNQQSMAEKDPLLGVLAIFKQVLDIFAISFFKQGLTDLRRHTGRSPDRRSA